MDIPIPKWLADIGLRVNRMYYRQLMHRLYGVGEKAPSWFDHRIDLYYQWPSNLFWLERGVLPRKHLFPGCRVLDLFCGDGFYSRFFHSSVAGQIDAVDKDPTAIEHAQRLYSHPKVSYVVADAVTDPFPATRYDVVLWFEAIEHLSVEQYRAVIEKIKAAIGKAGVLIGSTPIFDTDATSVHNWEHQNEFTSVDALRDFLTVDFGDVTIDTTLYSTATGQDRRTAHFSCRAPK